MTAFPSYSTGTVSIGAGATSVVGVGTVWSGTNAKPGDTFVCDGHEVTIIDVVDTTHLQIDAWPYSAVIAGASYKIIQNSPLRFAGGTAMASVNYLVSGLNTDGLFFYVPTADSVPDPSLGNDGQYALKPSTGEAWVKTGGVWGITGILTGLANVLSFTNTTEATGAGTTYAAKFAGGVEMLKKLFVTGAVSFASTLAVAGAVSFASTLAVAGAVSLSSTLNAAGNFSVATNKFTVAAASGNTVVAGTLAVAGAGTFASTVAINAASPQLTWNKAASGGQNILFGDTGGLHRWAMLIGDTAPESGANAGSDFTLLRYTDAGAYLNVALSVVRSSGLVDITNALSVGSTATSTDRSTGALVIGNGTSGGLGVGGQVSASKFAAFSAASSAVAFDATTGTSITVANGSSQAIAISYGLLVVHEITALGNVSLWLISNAAPVLVAQQGTFYEASTTTPTAGHASVAFNGAAYAIYNNRGGSSNFYVGQYQT